MASGFEVLGHSRALQMHWLRRVAAYVVDALVVLPATWAAFALLGSSDPYGMAIVSGIVFVVYGTAAEYWHGKTLGKLAVGLEVRVLRGPMTLRKAAARNAPKFFWYVFPLLDLLLGMLVQGDPRQRLSDRVVGTTVVWRVAAPRRMRSRVRAGAANR